MRAESRGNSGWGKTFTLLAVVVMAASACGPGEVDVRTVGSGAVRFVPQVVDAQGDAGSGLSLASGSDGDPRLAYLTFEPQARPGEPPPAPLPGGPTLPAVKYAALAEGSWSPSVVTEEAGVAGGDNAALALDGGGAPHVAWIAGSEVLYASAAGGGFSEPERVASGAVEGVSMTVDGEGIPWVAFYDGDVLRVGNRAGDSWTIEEVGAAREAAEPRTSAIAVGKEGVLVAFGDGSRTMLAVRGDGWSTGVVDQEGGRSVAMALDADGEPHIAYLTPSGEARHAHGPGGVTFTIFSSDGGSEESVGLDLAVDGEGVHHVVWSDGEAVRYAQDAGGEFEEQIIPTSEGGSRPQVVLGASPEIHVAWYEAEAGTLHLATLTDAPEPLLAVPGPAVTPGAPGPTAPPTGPPPCEPDGTELTISAQPGAVVDGFDKDCLAAPAGEAFTIEFENADPGVPHNVAVYTDESATESLFVGEVFPGTDTVTYEIPALEPGIYFFRCDVHPTTMTGTFVVA